MNNTVISLFAGIGGICTGFKQAGFNVVWANEKDVFSCRTYRHNLSAVNLVEADIRNIAATDIPDCCILTAGFPCQSFSVAGKQRGFNDSRGNLFFEIGRVIDTKRPDVIFLENVSNLIEHDNGKTFLVIHSVLSQFGYAVRYKTMSANEYGNIPQGRNRVYIVAFKDICASDRFRFPEPVDLSIHVSDIIDVHTKKADIYYYNDNDNILDSIRRMATEKGRIYNMYNGSIRKTRSPLCPTLLADMGMRPNRIPVVLDDYGYRKLTLRECLDFQGFPNEYYFPKSITINHAYKQIGNSVCIPVVRRIAEQIKLVINQ